MHEEKQHTQACTHSYNSWFAHYLVPKPNKLTNFLLMLHGRFLKVLGELILPLHHVDSHYFNLINAKCLQELSKVIHDLNPLRWSPFPVSPLPGGKGAMTLSLDGSSPPPFTPRNLQKHNVSGAPRAITRTLEVTGKCFPKNCSGRTGTGFRQKRRRKDRLQF